jgi:hypothetical protein
VDGKEKKGASEADSAEVKKETPEEKKAEEETKEKVVRDAQVQVKIRLFDWVNFRSQFLTDKLAICGKYIYVFKNEF